MRKFDAMLIDDGIFFTFVLENEEQYFLKANFFYRNSIIF